MRLIIVLPALLIGLSLLSPALAAPIWFETVNGGGDAGWLPATAQLVTPGLTGVDWGGVSGEIDSFTSVDDQVDMYGIQLTAGVNFFASTAGGASYGTQLFLFDSAGAPLAFNDDASPGESTSTLTFMPTVDGVHFLAISAGDVDPLNSGDEELFPDTKTGIHFPIVAGPVDDWTWAVIDSKIDIIGSPPDPEPTFELDPSYTIRFSDVPEPATVILVGLGLLAVFWRITKDASAR